MPPKASPTKSKKKGAGARRRKVRKVPRFTKEELNEEIDTFLTTYNPYMSENCVEFDRKMKSFKPVFDYRKPVVLYKSQGTQKRKLSEAVEILYAEGETAEEEEEKMRNKFNFRSVASQTADIHPSDHENQIDPSLFPILKFKGTVSKAEITAAYEKHEKKEKEKDNYDWVLYVLKKIVKYVGRKATPFQNSNRRYLRLSERMMDQNLSEANLDFSYYDNPNDEFRPNFGSLLPLWNFSCKLTRGLPVTGIAWNGNYADLFAVGYRAFKDEKESDDDDKRIIREEGCLCVYSLKGPAHPEMIMRCSSAIRCLSFHPEWAHLLATGCESGNVCVYDLRKEDSCPAGINKTTEKILHQDTVNELRWLPNTLPQKFCTASADGNVVNWMFLLNDLFPFDTVLSLQAKAWPGETPPTGIEMDSETTDVSADDMSLKMAGTSMSINPIKQDLFIVGTEAGVIYECSFDAKSLLVSFEDHKHTVGRIHWNPFHERVFLSCSDDMTVRIWDHNLSESVFDFFFEYEVKDVIWAPFSSTLFATISGNAVVYVFDLAVNKKEAIGDYTVYTAKQDINLTSLCFHPNKPILMVGDERGHVISFKLSPNLRSSLKARETIEESKFISSEVEKMEKLLAPAKGRKTKKE